MANKRSIINQALVRLGERTITDMSLPIGEIVSSVYDTVKDTLLASHRWRFAMKKVALSESSGDPVNEWGNHFDLPDDMVLLITTYPVSSYEIYEDKLLTNAGSVSVDYVYDPGEKKYPAYFVNAFAKQLSADTALAITHDKTLHELITVEAESAAAAARNRDSQGRPPTAIISRPFIDARR